MKRSLYEGYKSLYNKFHGAKTVSDFQTTGRMTAKEFVEAGDELAQKNPVWQWVGGPENIQDYLPANKKCLVYRGAPCLERAPVDDISGAPVVDITDEDGFVTTEATITQPKTQLPEEKVLTWDDDDDDDDDEADDPDATPTTGNANHDATNSAAGGPSARRVYDVYIVYDKYYETPRIYLVGYSGDRVTPLTTDQMKEDVYHSNYGKTVTIDNHPVLGFPSISIHPCRHAETMRHLMAQMKEKHDRELVELGKNPETEVFVFPVHLSLFLFLKFIASVVPTIKYDVSSSFEL